MNDANKRLWLTALAHHPRGLLVTAAAIIGIAYSLRQQTAHMLWFWVVGALGFTAIRYGIYLVCKADSRPGKTHSRWRHWQQIHEALLLLAGIQWAMLGWWGIPQFSGANQFIIIIVLAALAGGATATLAPLRVSGKIYILLVLIPACIRLSQQPDDNFIVLATLGSIFAWVMISGHESNFALLKEIVNLDLEKQALVDKMTAISSELAQTNVKLEQRVAERTEALQFQAHHDTLTKLLNRRGLAHFYKKLDRHTHPQVALAMIDLDHFKQINDGLGHDWGDLLLREVANRLAFIVQNIETHRAEQFGAVCRWGGDEFVVCIPFHDTAQRDISSQLELVRQALTEPYDIQDRQLHIGASLGFGIYALNEHNIELGEAIRLADLAVSEAKRIGRNRSLETNQSLLDLSARRNLMIEALRRATSDNSLHLVFQPIVSSSNHEVITNEALLRWNCPGIGPISPVEFIPLAEDTDHICDIGLWVLRRACKEAATWQDEHGQRSLNAKVAVNTSFKQLLQPEFVAEVASSLQEAQLAPSRLIIEVTETVFNEEDMQQVLAVIHAVRALGVEVHIDDFGTGYSSLSRLHEFPITAIKVDKSFVLAGDERALAVIEGAVFIAKRFGLKVVAEGVETPAQAEALMRLGVDELQGYHFGRPANLAEQTQTQ